MANMNFEDALELALQTTKKYIDNKIEINGFSGDYNDLANRPCYDDREFSEVELTFDGVLEGKETAQLMYYNIPESINDPTIVRLFGTEIVEGFTLIRLSSKPVTYEELCTTTHLNIVSGNNHYEFDYSDIDMKDYVVKHNESVSTLTCPFYSNASLFSNFNMTKLENENDIVKAALISSDIYIKNIYAINEETDLEDVFTGEAYVKADRVLSPGLWMQYFALGDSEIEYIEGIRYKEILSGELKKLDPKFIPNEIYKLLEPLTEDDIDFIINILDGI